MSIGAGVVPPGATPPLPRSIWVVAWASLMGQAQSGLGDGLEGFMMLIPWVMLFIFFVAAVCGRAWAQPQVLTPAAVGEA